MADMDPVSVEALQSAVDQLNDDDIEPFVALMADDMQWTGLGRGWRLWRDKPS